MLKTIREALGITETPAPARPSSPQSTALVPVHRPISDSRVERPDASMGYLDRMPDSSRPMVPCAPFLRTADQEIRIAHGPVAGAARHLLTQSGFLQYGVELNVCWISGPHGLEPSITVDAARLGWSEAKAKTWARTLEQRFAEWADDPRACDAQARFKWGALQGAMVRSYLGTGDIIAALDYGPKNGTRWKTAINLLDPVRLATPYMWQDRRSVIRDGVEFDARGRALAYHIRPLPGHHETIRIPVYSGGKQMLAHSFDAEAGAIRGISPLGSAIGAILQSQNAHDAAVLAAHIAATIAGVVTSDLPSDAVARSISGEDGNPLAAMMASRVSWHEALKKNDAHLRLGHGARIVHLSTGEKFDLHAGKTSFTEYEKIIRLGLAEAARGLGIAPEHLHGLKDQASYSALKVAASEARAIMERRRAVLLVPVSEWALWSVAEELIDRDELPWGPSERRGNAATIPGIDRPPLASPSGRRSAPRDKLADFRENRGAVRVEWRGPIVEDPDVLKATKAAIERLRYGLSSLTDEISAMGRDPETVLNRRAEDEAALAERGLTLPWPPAPIAPRRTS